MNRGIRHSLNVRTALRAGVRLVCALSFVTLAVACYGDSESDDEDGGSAPVSSDGFPQRFASTYCSNIQSCCERADQQFDRGSCEDALIGYLGPAFRAQLSNPGVRFDEVVGGKCIEAYGVALRACTDRDLWNDADDACDGIFYGTVPAGGACSESSECETPEGGYASCELGVCVVESQTGDLAHGGLGDACSSTCTIDEYGGSCGGTVGGSPGSAGCYTNDGLVCGPSSVCEAAPEAGQPCVSYHCTEGAFCSAGMCQQPSAAGPCSADQECVSSSFCDYAQGQCAPLKADGEPCDSDGECLNGGCEGDRCRKWSVADAETCAGLLD